MKKSNSVLTSRHFGRMPKTKTLKMYFTRKAKNQIVQDLGFGELYLLEYWLETTGRPTNYVIDDKVTALALGLSVRAIQKYRLALQKANLFRTIKSTAVTGIQQITYCFGKEGVYTATYFPDLFGFGISSMTEAMKIHKPAGVKAILDDSPIKPWERKDMYQLFNHKYDGEFVCEEAA